MPKRKRQSKKKLTGIGRLKDATRWLRAGGSGGKPLAATYAKRYGIPDQTARYEPIQLGYYDELCIQDYDDQGVEWEYRVDGRSGDMFVVPKDSEEHEMYEIHGIL